MTRADWRSPGAYEDLRSLDAPGFAWEYLRRNPEFQRHCKKLERAVRQGALDQAEADAFARRWGLRFREHWQDQPAPLIAWSAPALPSVVALTKLPADLADPEFRLPPLALGAGLSADGAERLVECRGTGLRIHIDETGVDPPAVLLPLDRLFEIRAAAAIRLWRGLSGRNPGLDPARLSRLRRDKLILALRALDACSDDVSYREVAAVLFGAAAVSERGWKSHDLRGRTIRLVHFGYDMMQGGYRHLLLHPYRRRP